MGTWLLSPFKSKKYNELEIHRNYFKSTDDVFTVLLLGGSTSRELTDSNTYISKLLSERCALKINFINAGSPAQSYVASQSIYDYYSRRGVGLVIIGANYLRYILNEAYFKEISSQYRGSIPISLNLFLEEYPNIQNPPQIEPLYLLSKLYIQNKKNNLVYESNFLFSKIQFLKDKVGFQNRFFSKSESWEKRNKRLRHFDILRYEDFLNFGPNQSRRWNLFIDNALSKGSKVLFIDLPKAPYFDKKTNLFQGLMNEFLDSHLKNGANVIRMKSSDLNLKDDDFYDQQHLLSSGRKKVESLLIESIADNISECKIK